jgi:hypothetical protein
MAKYFQKDRDVFFHPPEDYQPYTYPHPMRGEPEIEVSIPDAETMQDFKFYRGWWGWAPEME